MCTDFNISTKPWKAEPESDLCRCCHSQGTYKNINTSYFWMDVEEVVYSNMVRECFNIELLQILGHTQQMFCAICYTCVQRLEDAVRFKRQIEKCERRFEVLYKEYAVKDPTFAVAIKQETLDRDFNTANDSTAPYNGCTNDTSHVDLVPIKYNGDDDNHHDDGSYKLDDEEDIPLLQDKKGRKPKKLKNKSVKIKKKNSPLKNAKKNRTSESVNDEVLDTIEGVIEVVKRVKAKRDVDYKKIDGTFQCLKCNFTAKSTHGVREHVRTVHLNVFKHVCSICNKTFSTLASFTKHKLEEHNIDHRFKCKACEHAFNTKVQLKRHINTFHMLGVKIKCKECDYETFSVESLYKHKFKHKTVKDYKCQFCRKAFVRKTTLQMHERIHTGDRRKVCAVCGQAFVQKASLNYHMTKYHPEIDF